MDDAFGSDGDFDADFDFDNGDFSVELGDGTNTMDAIIAAGLSMGDNSDEDGGNGDGTEPNSKRRKQAMGEYASSLTRYGAGSSRGGTAVLNEEAPPPIENVQAYLPNCTPDAFPVVVNVLAQAIIPEGPDLRKLSCATRNVEFMPRSRNASATMRLQDPNAVVMIRSSGSMAIIGAASISEARQAAELAARIVRKALNMDFQTFRFRVRSISARFNVCSPVRINDLATFRLDRDTHRGLSEVHCSYEPERFNGCVVKLVGAAEENKWIATCLVFVTGKTTIMGARSADELRFAFDALVPILQKYIGSTDLQPEAQVSRVVA